MKTWTPGFLMTLVIAAASTTQAQADPDKILHLVVGVEVGSTPDVRARWLADKLPGVLKQTVVVENRPGAAGNLSAAAVARAPADGNTLLVVHQGLLAINPHLFARPASTLWSTSYRWLGWASARSCWSQGRRRPCAACPNCCNWPRPGGAR